MLTIPPRMTNWPFDITVTTADVSSVPSILNRSFEDEKSGPVRENGPTAAGGPGVGVKVGVAVEVGVAVRVGVGVRRTTVPGNEVGISCVAVAVGVGTATGGVVAVAIRPGRLSWLVRVAVGLGSSRTGGVATDCAVRVAVGVGAKAREVAVGDVVVGEDVASAVTDGSVVTDAIGPSPVHATATVASAVTMTANALCLENKLNRNDCSMVEASYMEGTFRSRLDNSVDPT